MAGDADILSDLEEAEKPSGSELDDDAFSGSELDDEVFNGPELDGSNIGENKTVVTKAVPAARQKEKKSKKRIVLFGGLGLFMFVLIIGLVIGKKLFHIDKPQGKKPMIITEDQLMEFDSFVIPFKGNTNFSYIHLSISFVLLDQELKTEIAEKRNLLRGTIYDLLKTQADQAGWFPSLEQLKELVKQAVNMNLSAGEIDELYITQYLVV